MIKNLFLKTKNHIWVLLTVLIMLSLGFSGLLAKKSEQENNKNPQVEHSTYIPKGYRLLTIDIENYQSVDQSFGQYGFVSLYIRDTKKTRLIVRGLRMLRSPLNNKVFGVLVPEAQVNRLLSEEKPFYVALQGQANSGTEFVKPNRNKSVRKPRTIEVGEQ